MSQIQQVKEATDIVQVIGSRIDLKRAGSSWRGLCPFHGEKSPSFFVNDSFQRYKCFGCGETGDVFTFLEKYEGMTFYEALSFLADAAGIELQKHSRSHEDDERDEQLAALNQAKEYYHYIFTKHAAGKPGKTYAKERGITSDSIKTFQLGYAPDGWDGLIKYLHGKKNVPLTILEKAGLVARARSGKYYDRFRGRLMFPLLDHRGRVVGFSGRLLESEAKEAKYINSPETGLYHKSKMLYGYHELKQSIRSAGHVLVVEGELDVISSVQAHVSNIVAIKGSALTEDHARLLRRLVPTVILALDTDSAGVEATKKAIPILKKHGLDLRVVSVPDGKDPDDMAQKNPKLWREVVKDSETVYDFFITSALAEHDHTKPEGKRAIMNAVAEVLQWVDHAVEREHYIKELATKLGVKQEAVVSDLQSYAARAARKTNKRRRSPEKEQAEAPTHTSTQHERYLTKLVLSAQIADVAEWFHTIDVSLIAFAPLSLLLNLLKGVVKGSEPLLSRVAELPSDIQEALFAIYTDEELLVPEKNTSAEWQRVFDAIAKQSIHKRVQVLSAELKTLEAHENLTEKQEVRIHEILEEISELKRQ